MLVLSLISTPQTRAEAVFRTLERAAKIMRLVVLSIVLVLLTAPLLLLFHDQTTRTQARPVCSPTRESDISTRHVVMSVCGDHAAFQAKATIKVSVWSIQSQG